MASCAMKCQSNQATKLAHKQIALFHTQIYRYCISGILIALSSLSSYVWSEVKNGECKLRRTE